MIAALLLETFLVLATLLSNDFIAGSPADVGTTESAAQHDNSPAHAVHAAARSATSGKLIPDPMR